MYQPTIFFLYIFRNLFAYYASVYIVVVIGKVKIHKIQEFIIISLIGIIFYSFYSKFYGYSVLVKECPYQLRYYIHYIFANIQGLITLVIPLSILWKIKQDKTNGFYGLHFKNMHYNRYYLIYVIIIFIVFAASFMSTVSEFYPMLKYTYYKTAAAYWHVPKWLTTIGYEISYSIDFVLVELFFRGFLIIGLTKYLGKDVILPMIVLYAVIHFGKPLPETISSFFGGYILGVLAYSQKHIRTGISFHWVLALGMEFFALLRFYGIY
jgi:hypothetical protein